MKTITNKIQSQTENQFYNSILTANKCNWDNYKEFSKDYKKELANMVQELHNNAKTKVTETTTTIVVPLNAEQLEQVKKFIFVKCPDSKNELKRIIANTLQHARKTGLQKIDETKDEKQKEQALKIGVYQFFKMLQVNCYLCDKKVIYNKLTKVHETRNI